LLILIENTVCLNAGDGAIMRAIIKILRDEFGPSTRFVAFDSDPEVSKRYFPDIEFHPLTSDLVDGDRLALPLIGRRWNVRLRRNLARLRRRALFDSLKGAPGPIGSLFLRSEASRNISLYKEANLVVSTGGTYLVEHYNMDNRFLEFEKDFALGKPLVLFTQSLGPFSDPANQASMRRTTAKAALTLLRDEKSHDNLKAISAEGNIHVVSDSVFAFADLDALATPRPARDGRPQIAVSVRDWAHFEGLTPAEGMARYMKAVSEAVIALARRKNAQITFVSTCQGVPKYRYDDSAVAAEIAAGLPADVASSVNVDRDFHTVEQLVTTLKGFDFVIATRMHMAILSLCAGTPVLPISYEFKTTQLFAGLGQSEWLTDISHIDQASFVTKVLAFCTDTEAFRSAIVGPITAQATSARSAGALVRSALRDHERVAS
jgi:colanic acid/amylovoran biosynthesis protein